MVDSNEICPINTTMSGTPIGRAVCVNDTSGELVWNITEYLNDCGPFRGASQILEVISQEGVTNETVIEVLEDIADIVDMELDENDIDIIATIISNSTALESGDPRITTFTTAIISEFAEKDEEELSDVEDNTGAITEILESFEEQLNNVDILDGQSFMASERNVAVQVTNVEPTDFSSGLTISASSTTDDLRESDITLNATDSPNQGQDISGTRVSIPPSVLNDFADDSEGEAQVRVALSVFRTSSLFASARIRETNRRQNNFNLTVNSLIVGLTLGGRKMTSLRENIGFKYTPLQMGQNPQCVFWDFEETLDWSERGCQRITSSSSEKTEEIECSCDHLTNFAVLMDIYAERVEALRIISIIGCAISIVCLLIILITYLSNKKLRSHQSQKIFICLCGTLLSLYVTFLIMSALDQHPSYSEVAPIPCGILAALVHFFTLSSLAWMGVEGFNTYLIVVRVFDSYIPRFMLKAGLVAWGACGLIVLVTGIAARGNYAESDYCFLQKWPAIGGLLIPIALILLANIVIFSLVVRRLIKSANLATGRDSTANNRKASVERVKNAISVLVLLGLTWTTGYLTLIDTKTQVIRTLFIVFNSLQGFFIFVLYCGRNPAVRAYWARMCGCGRSSPRASTGADKGTSQTRSSANTHDYSSSMTYFSQTGKGGNPDKSTLNNDQSDVHDNPAYEDIEEGVKAANLADQSDDYANIS